MQGDRQTCCKLKEASKGKEASKENRHGNKCKRIIYSCQ